MKTLGLLFSYVIFTCLASVILFSCLLRGNCHGSDGPIHSRLDSIHAKAYRVQGIKTANPGYGLLDTIAYDGNKIRFDSIVVHINAFVSIAQVQESPGGIISSAYACDPVTTADKIQYVTITSDVDYNGNFAAGADLKSIMKVSYGFEKATASVEQVVLNGLYDNVYRFTEAPSSDKLINLTFRYELSNGKVYIVQVKNVNIY